jgi:hypothetical protein
VVRIVKSGRWLYDSKVEKPVDIVGLDYDFWYEIARVDGNLEEGEEPVARDEDGLIYYVRFASAGDTTTPTWPDSVGYSTIAEAMASAESRCPSLVTWE